MSLSTEWHKSTRSGTGGNCVETRLIGEVVEVRDTKDRQGPVLPFDARTWQRFVDSLR